LALLRPFLPIAISTVTGLLEPPPIRPLIVAAPTAPSPRRAFVLFILEVGMNFRLCRSSRAHLKVFHQELILSLSSEQYIDEVTVLRVLVVTVLLLEYHIRGVEGLKSLLNHLQLRDILATEAELSDYSVDSSVVCLHCLEVEEAEVGPATARQRE
jgi:hypothetical protein